MKFSIVTPVYNGEKYIAETIESVLSQEGDFEIEYIIQDGGSTDRTIEIIKRYKRLLDEKKYPVKCNRLTMQWFSENDNGMYDAVHKGFARATGEVCAYINADDTYTPNAFNIIASVFRAYSEIQWVKGISKLCDENSTLLSTGFCYVYRQPWIMKGVYGRSAPFIQQESVFWKRTLWEKARPHISSFRLAGDYALWISFAKYAPLWSLNKRISVFRRHSKQLSTSINAYRIEQEKIAPHNFFLEKRAVIFFSLRRFLNLNPKGIATRIFFFILFPFYKKERYIDFDVQNNPIKKIAASYIA